MLALPDLAPERRARTLLSVLAIVLSSLPALEAANTVRVEDASGAAGSSIDIGITIENDFAILGWSFGVCADPAALDVTAASLSAELSTLSPEMFQVDVLAEGARALVLMSLDPLETLAPQAAFPVLSMTATLLGAPGSTTTVAVCDGIGTPPVDVVFASATPQTELVPTTVDGTVTIDPPSGNPTFERLDCNQDGSRNIADPITLLTFLFAGGDPSPCAVACDANDDGTLNVADAIVSLGILLGGSGDPILAPVTCGTDPTPDAIPCVAPICP